MKLSLAFLVVFFLSGCSQVTQQNRIVFESSPKIDEIFPEQECSHVHSVEDFKELAIYQPDDDFKAYLRLVTPGSDNLALIGPGIPLPLPVVPTVVGSWNQSLARTNEAVSYFSTLRLAVYPYPHIRGYSFDPSQVRISVDGDIRTPEKIQFLETHNRELREPEVVSGGQKLKPHTGEYQAFILDFPLDDYEYQALHLTVSGVSSDNGAVKEQTFALVSDYGMRFDWWYDIDCQ